MFGYERKSWSLILLAAPPLLLGCDEEPDAWEEEPGQEIAARDLSLCATVPAHATVTLSASGIHSRHAASATMSQPGCDHRFVVDFDSSEVGQVRVTPDLHHFTTTSGSWAFYDANTCTHAHAVMDVYTQYEFGVLTKLNTYEFVGVWDNDTCTPVEVDGHELPVVPASIVRIRLATRAWTEAGYPITAMHPAVARATVKVLHGDWEEDTPRPVFRLPFFYEQEWYATTYGGHSPNPNSIDLRRVGGTSKDQIVVASADGTVVEVGPVLEDGTGVYFGDYVDVDHGGGWVTRYLHIDRSAPILPHATVVRGQRLGTVGEYQTMEPHLHYTQFEDGDAVRVAFDGTPIDVHAGAQNPDDSYPWQNFVSENIPTGWTLQNLAQGAAVKSTAGAGARAVVRCESVGGATTQVKGARVPAGETSTANCPANWSVTQRGIAFI